MRASAPPSSPPPQGTARMDALPDDLLLLCLSRLCEADLSRCASVSRCFARVCAADELWRHVCRRRWPQLGSSPRFATVYSPLCASGSWRALHQCRATTPRWREVCFRLDLSLHAVGAGRAEDWPESLASTLSALAGVMSSGVASEEERAWAVGLAAQLGAAEAPLLGALGVWARALEGRLDEWFEAAAAHTPHAAASTLVEARRRMAEALLAVLTGRSALAVLEDALLSETVRAELPGFEKLWRDAGLPHAIYRVDVSLESFKLEGCNLSVSAARRLPGVPMSHWWWWLQPPIFVSGGNPHTCC
ncbi:hypothetical protein AB1Y20_018083 [Prymnesium parvum]|uniref:F-box domain-containing protein n=1 Tax=Prymnesium parvum TaxID=97485 RepID=A0AB34JQJ2_PRYPA